MKMRALAIVVAVLTLFPLNPAAQATPGGQLAIGDSVMLGAAGPLRARGFKVNARVSRQFGTAPGILRSYGASLPGKVVLHLGTNGRISLAACKSAVRTAGPNRRVFLVTNRVPRSWQNGNNSTLHACARAFPGQAQIVDWYSASAGHGAYFGPDRVHLTGAGRTAYARLIAGAVG